MGKEKTRERRLEESKGGLTWSHNQVTEARGVKIYNVSAGKSLPEWLSEKVHPSTSNPMTTPCTHNPHPRLPALLSPYP